MLARSRPKNYARNCANWVRKEIGPIASPDFIQWAPGLPKTRSGKIMRRILRKIAENAPDQLGDTSTLADPSVLGHGASGFIPKSADVEQIGKAINAVLDGDTWLPPGVSSTAVSLDPEEEALASKVAELTPQQYRVLTMVCNGLLNKQIAYELNVSEATIKAHMTAILRKLGAHSRTQAVLLAGKLTVEGRASKLPVEEDES
jgi:DNA-binding CsgD family transcriptional regulator